MGFIQRYFYWIFESTKEEYNEHCIRYRWHKEKHYKNIFWVSLPVFIAAMFSRSFGALSIAICGQNVYLLVLLNALYTVLIAHPIGYVVPYYVSRENPNYEYYAVVVTEIAGFAWFDTIYLCVIDMVMSTHGTGFAMLVWTVIAVLVLLFVTLWNYFHIYYVKASAEILKEVKVFEGNIFALALAYTFYLILLSGICGVDFLYSMDLTDDYSQDEHGSLCTQLGIFFPMVLTVLVSHFQSSGVFDEIEEYVAEDEINEESIRSSMFRNSDETQSGIELNDHKRGYIPPVLDISGEIAISPFAEKVVESKHSALNESNVIAELAEFNIFSAIMQSLNPVVEACSRNCCAWDSDRHSRQSYLILFFLLCGYFVGCSWYIWAVFTFQNFAFFDGVAHGSVLGMLVFCVVFTWICIESMTVFSTVYEEALIEGTLSKKNTKVKLRRMYLMYTAYSLTVGWAWEEWFLSVVGLIVNENRGDVTITWIRALLKSLVTVGIFFLGRFIYKYKGSPEPAEKSNAASQHTSEKKTGELTPDVVCM